MKVAIIDIDMGNLCSLSSAFSFIGAKHFLASSAQDLEQATHLILPGVGCYDAAMNRLTQLGLIQPIRDFAQDHKKPVLGICLGMQLLCESSQEGKCPGLALVPGHFKQLEASTHCSMKVPHVGFSRVYGYSKKSLFQDLGSESFFYFTHSYALPSIVDNDFQTAMCSHVVPFVAAYQRNNISGTQFHPEKSQAQGLRLLKNFLMTDTQCEG